MTNKSHHEFQDKSGLTINVDHVITRLGVSSSRIESGKLVRDRGRTSHQQPSSIVSVTVPEGSALTPAAVFELIANTKPPENYQPKDNIVQVGTVVTMLDQPRIIGALSRSGLFAKETIAAVNECCNNPTPSNGLESRGVGS